MYKKIKELIEVPRSALTLIVILALIPRVMLSLTQSVLIWADSIGYYRSALYMIERQLPVSREIFHSPLYPLFLATFFSQGFDPSVGLAVVITQHLLGLLTVIFFYLTAREVFNSYVAFFASFLLSFHVLLLTYESIIQTEILFCFLLSIVVYLSIKAIKSNSLVSFALVGFYCGLTVLTRPVAQQYLVCLLLVFCFVLRNFKMIIKNVLTTLVTYLIVVMPFMYLNLKEQGFWGLTHGEGLNLILRSIDLDKFPPVKNTKYPEVKKIYHEVVDIGHHKFVYTLKKRLVKNLHYSPLEADHIMLSFATEIIKAHPVGFIKYSLIDLFYFFAKPKNSVVLCPVRAGAFGCLHEHRIPEVFKLSRNHDYLFLDPLYSKFSLNGNFMNKWFVLFSFIGVFLYFYEKYKNKQLDKSCAPALLLVMTVAYFSTVTVAFDIPHDRFRLPVDPIIIIFAVYGIEKVLAKIGILVFPKLIPSVSK